jgi:hypothetical protein
MSLRVACQVVLTGVLMFITEVLFQRECSLRSAQGSLQLVVGLGIAIMYGILHVKLQPLEESMDDSIQSMALAVTVLTLMGAIVVNAGEGGTPVTLFLLFVNLAVVVFTLYAIVVLTFPTAVDSLQVPSTQSRDSIPASDSILLSAQTAAPVLRSERI